MGCWRYFYHGLGVLSDLQLSELEPFEKASLAGEPDVKVSLSADSVDLGTAPEVENEYRFFIKGVGWYQVHAGREIVVQPLRDAMQSRVRLFLLGSAWGALLYQRKALLIHASAVQIGDGAVAFCAVRGGGKSTLAAMLGAHGHNLVSDDLCCIRFQEGETPMIYPSIPRVRLWSDAIRELGWETSTSEPDQMRPGKFQYTRGRSACTTPLPVRGIYILGWGETRIDRLMGFDALQRFISAARWRADILLCAGTPAHHLQSCAELLQQVPVSEFRRPRNFAASLESVKILSDSWHSSASGS